MVERVLSLEGGYVAPWSRVTLTHCASWSSVSVPITINYIGQQPGPAQLLFDHPAPACCSAHGQQRNYAIGRGGSIFFASLPPYDDHPGLFRVF